MTEEDLNPFAAPQSLDSPPSVNPDIDFASLRPAGTGLGLVYGSLLLIVLVVVGVFASVLYGANQRPGADFGAMVGYGVLIGSILSALLSLIGGTMCATVPKQTNAKGLAIASVVLQATYLVIVVIGVLAAAKPPFLQSTWSGLLATGLTFSAAVCFLLYLRKIAMFIEQPALAGRTIRVMVAFAVTSLLGVALFVVISTANMTNIVLGLLTGGAFLCSFLMYANLINAVGKSIRHPERIPSQGHIG